MALAMATTLAFSSVPVFAAEATDETEATGSSEGAGTLEGYVDTDVFRVVLPTEATENSTFAFTMDPQHLLNQTGESGYGASDTVFFANASSSFSGTSEALTAQNKGTVKVDVSVTATASDLGTDDVKVPLTADKTFANDETTSLYLGLIMGSDAAIPLDASTLSATATTTLDAVADGSYEFKKEGDEYKYVLKDSVTSFPETSFKMEGACNEDGDKDAWLAVRDAGIAPNVSVAWTLQKHGPRAIVTKNGRVTVMGIPAGVSVDLTKSTYQGSTEAVPYSIAAYQSNWTIDDSGYTADNGGTIVYQMAAGTLSYFNGQDLDVTMVLSDGTSLSATSKEIPKPVKATIADGKLTVSNLPAGVSVDPATTSYHGSTDPATSYTLASQTANWTLDDSGYSADKGGKIVYTMSSTVTSYFSGQTFTVNVSLTDGSTLVAQTTL